MTEQNLKSKTKKGLVWSLLERIGTQGIQFFFSILLARILSPEDYGIIAMPLIFLTIAQVFINSGFGNALIRKTNLTEEDLSTAFYFNIGVGCVCYAVLFFSSPLIADFYNTPILSDLLKVSALATLFNPLCIVQQTILSRKLEFKTQAYISVSGQIVTGIIGLYLALNGYGVWSLVVQQVGGYVLRTALFWILGKWYPKTGWSWKSFEYLWGFGSKLLASALMDTVYNNIYPIVIGKFYTANALGEYSRAQHFADLPSQNLTGVLQRVTYPVLSTIQEENERLKANYRKMLRLSAFVIFPIMVGLSAAADPFIRVLLGDKWEGCIILLQIICFNLMWYPIHAINLNLLQVKGRSDLFLRLEIIKKIVGIVILVICVLHGIIWMAVGGVASSVFALLINTYYTGKMINVGFFKQMSDLLPILLISLIMWGAIVSINILISNSYVELLIDVTLGAIIYILSSKLFLKAELQEVLNLLPPLFKTKIKKYE